MRELSADRLRALREAATVLACRVLARATCDPVLASPPSESLRKLRAVDGGGAIFTSRPAPGWSPEVVRMLDRFETAAPSVAEKGSEELQLLVHAVRELGTLARDWSEAMERRAVEEPTDLTASSGVQPPRIFGDVYEQILGMTPRCAAEGGHIRIDVSTSGGAERAQLGAHYTAETLVLEVVRAALEPVFAATWARTQGRPDDYAEQLLGLRVLDPAMGTAHFLTVAALEIARERAYALHYGTPRPSEYFEVVDRPLAWVTLDWADRPALDLRVAEDLPAVVQRCCFGVDRSPLAVELAKLSLWQLSGGGGPGGAASIPPDFLGGNLRIGDSLVGRVHAKQGFQGHADLVPFHWPEEFPEVFSGADPGFDVVVGNPPFLGDREQRASLGRTYVDYVRSTLTDGKAPDLCGLFLRRIEQLVSVQRGVVGLVTPNTVGQGKNRRYVLVPLVQSGPRALEIFRACRVRGWPGDAAVHVSTLHLRRLDPTLKARRRRVIRDEAGELRVVSSEFPISSYLDDGPETALHPLRGAQGLAFQGMIPRGPFDFDLELLRSIPRGERDCVYAYLNGRSIQQQPRPIPSRGIVDVYDALEAVGLAHAPPEAQEQWLRSHRPTIMDWLATRVRPTRVALADSRSNRPHKERWWLFGSVREGLRTAWEGLDTVMVMAATGKVFAPVFLPRRDDTTGLPVRLSHSLYVIPSSSRCVFGLFASKLFETQVRRSCSSMKSDLRFTPSEVFPQFPFPWPSPELRPPRDAERSVAESVDLLVEVRSQLLVHPERHGLPPGAFRGPTDLYNAFDDDRSPWGSHPSMASLRRAHIAVENAVLALYGWDDLAGETWVFERPWLDGSRRYVPPLRVRRAYLSRLAGRNAEQARRG